MLKISGSKSVPKLTLVSEESIPGRWVHKYNRFWGGKRIIERYDATIEPIMNGNHNDAKLVEAIGEVRNNSLSHSTKGNPQIQKIVDQKQPICVTRYTITDSVCDEKNRTIGLIRSGNDEWTYYISNDGDIMIKYVDPKEIEELKKLKEIAKNRRK